LTASTEYGIPVKNGLISANSFLLREPAVVMRKRATLKVGEFLPPKENERDVFLEEASTMLALKRLRTRLMRGHASPRHAIASNQGC
jgi:hypothetical protein